MTATIAIGQSQHRASRPVGARMLRSMALVVVVAASLLACAPAEGATVVVHRSTVDLGKGPDPSVEVVVTGDGADADDLTVAPAGTGQLQITDGGAPLTTDAAECVVLDVHTLRCTNVAGASVAVAGGAGDDRLAIDGALSATLSGGPGDDLLEGGTNVATLDGGPGRDVVRGRGGLVLATLETDDGLTGDVVDAGPGGGRLVVTGTAPGLTLDLATGTVVGPDPGSAADTVAGFADVTMLPPGSRLFGGDGPDVLRGSGLVDGRGGADVVLGGRGVDRLVGGPGDDRIGAGPGDVIDAGEGDDHVGADSSWPIGPSRRATIACGPGDDELVAPMGATFTPLDCERTRVLAGIVFRAPVRSVHTLLVRATIRATACGYVVWARSPGSHRVLTPMVRRRLTRTTAVVASVPLPYRGRAQAVEIAVAYATSCPRAKPWPRFRPSFVGLVVAGG
jgi:hypothetical protein